MRSAQLLGSSPPPLGMNIIDLYVSADAVSVRNDLQIGSCPQNQASEFFFLNLLKNLELTCKKEISYIH